MISMTTSMRIVKQSQEAPAEAAHDRRQLSEPVLPAGGPADKHDPDPLEEILREKDAIKLLEQEMQGWSRPERETFELYYLEGLEPDEITMVTNYPPATVQASLAAVRRKLHKHFHQQLAAA